MFVPSINIKSFRVLWKRFLVEVDAGIIFVYPYIIVLYLVDSADCERFEEVKTVFICIIFTD